MTVVTTGTQKTKLYRWHWSGKSLQGRKVKGETVSPSKVEVEKMLLSQSIIIKRVKRKGFGGRMGRVKPRDIMLFSRQMATMIRAGVPIMQAFQIVAESQKKPVMSKLVQDLISDVSAGASFAEALKRHPQYFDRLFRHLVEAGEQSGSLDIMLERVATYKEKLESLKRRVKKAMVYPAAVILVGIGVTALLLIKVVPQFESLFSGFNTELPAMTRVTITFSEWAQSYWAWVVGIVAIISLLFFQAMKRSNTFAYNVHRSALKIPILGTILNKSAVARYARTLATTFGAGVPLVEALTTASGATGNRVYEKSVINVREDVATGQQLHFAMRMTGQFPALAVQMVGIGEEAGSLDAMLNRVADYYEEEVDNMVDNLTTLMEPFILVMLGGMVGFLVVSMYLPIFELGNVV